MKVGIKARRQSTGAVCELGYEQIYNLLVASGALAKQVPPGLGTAPDDPFRPWLLEHWYYLPTLEFSDDPIFIRAGGRLIARWGRKAKHLKGYTSDVTDINLGEGYLGEHQVERGKEGGRDR